MNTRHIDVTELVLRDGHQSLMATRMALEDMLPACEDIAKAGYWSVECWGGATFDACIRFLNEDPWERLRAFRKAMPNSRLQMLLRGQNLLGYRHYEDTVVDRFVEKAFAETKLKDVDFAKSLFAKSTKELDQSGDPLLDLMKALYADFDALKERRRVFNARIKELRKTYLEAVAEWKKGLIYPDANSTMRFTYGYIGGYSPADGVFYTPFTTLTGVIAKHTGVEPFDAPEALRQLHERRDFGRWLDPGLEDVPVNFLHGCDITGGNSGSAVMNARGELIGLAFDGNWEALTSDWQYNPALQRTISVDIRYVLFLTEKLAGADHLLQEMGIK